MVPVAGSAYTYAYATLGELFAWIIGWDLVLEYAVGSATVAHGWSATSRSCSNLRDPLPQAFARRPTTTDVSVGAGPHDGLRQDRLLLQPARRAHRSYSP
jgi:APA family basic amino acid/polyamine antiporter